MWRELTPDRRRRGTRWQRPHAERRIRLAATGLNLGIGPEPEGRISPISQDGVGFEDSARILWRHVPM